MTEQSDPQTFNVVSSGQPRAGFERAAVAEAMAQLKMAPALVEQLLGGRRLIVKRGVGREVADSYRQRLWSAGLEVDVVAATAAATATAPSSSVSPSLPTSTRAVADTPAPTAPINPLSAAARAADRRLAARWLLALLSTAAMPVVLSLLLIGVFALLTHHAISHAIWLQVPPWWWSGLLYLLPLLLGLVAVALLLRPLLVPPPPVEAPALGRDAEPVLWQLLDEIAGNSGLPLPAGLRLTSGCDSRVALAPGRAGWQRGETVLTLGLAPLRQPAPLLQATLAAALVEALPRSARLRQLAERVERWLAANADGRDRWQQWLLERTQGDEPPRWLGLLRGFEPHYQRLATRLFTTLLTRCRAALLPARRAQLLEADRFAAAWTGSARFADWRQTQRCWQWAATWAQPFALEHPVENLPALIAHAALQPEPSINLALTVEFNATPTPNATWPSERSRIDRIAALALPTPSPATTELDLSEREIAVTAADYRARGIDAIAPLPTEQSEQLVALLREREQAATRYFNGWLHPERGWRLPDAALIGALSLNDATEQLHVCVNEIRRLTPDRARLLTTRERLQQQLTEFRLGNELLSLRQPFSFRTVGIEPAALPMLIEQKQGEIDKLNEQLALQESIMGGRLALGLRLSGQADEEIDALRAGLDFFSELLERVLRLHGDAELLAGLAARPLTSDARPVLQRLRERVAENSDRLLRRLEQAPPFPEQHVETPARRVRRRLPATGDTGDSAIAQRALTLCSACRDLHVELSKLAAEWASGSEESYAIETIRRV